MYTIANNSIFEVTWEGNHDGQQVITQLHYKYSGATQTDGREFGVGLLNQIANPGGLQDAYLGCISEDVKNITIYGQWIYPIRYAYIATAFPSNDGSIIGPCLPANVSQAVIRRGELADQTNRSVLKLPGVPVAAVVNSMLTNAQKDLLQVFGDESVVEMTFEGGNVMRPVALHRATPSASASLVEAFPGDAVRILRRRTVGLGA